MEQTETENSEKEILRIYLEEAYLNYDIDVFGKMDPYVILKSGD